MLLTPPNASVNSTGRQNLAGLYRRVPEGIHQTPSNCTNAASRVSIGLVTSPAKTAAIRPGVAAMR